MGHLLPVDGLLAPFSEMLNECAADTGVGQLHVTREVESVPSSIMASPD